MFASQQGIAPLPLQSTRSTLAQSSPNAPPKSFPKVSRHTTDDLGSETGEYIPREYDDAGEKRVTDTGHYSMAATKSIFRQFGARIIVNGRRLRDDYWESNARKQGWTEEYLLEEKKPKPRAAKAINTSAAERTANSSMIFSPRQCIHPEPQTIKPGMIGAGGNVAILPACIPSHCTLSRQCIRPDSVPSNTRQVYNQIGPFQHSGLGYVSPSKPTNPGMAAFHQAHVTRPRLAATNTAPDESEDDPSSRFYQSVKVFAMGPTKIFGSTNIFEFVISAAVGNLQYRLRCAQPKDEVTGFLMPDWVISDTIWPENCLLEIDGHKLELHKGDGGKDIPVNITSFIHPNPSPDGVNRIKISTSQLWKAAKETCYFIAVEIVEVHQHAQILEMCHQSQHIPAAITLNDIKNSFTRQTRNDDDDDLTMLVSDLSSGLTDPYTARIFDTPVRGTSCVHRECFDLTTFLLTRNLKSKTPDDLSMIDIWKCPLCGEDARPYSLQIDDFFAHVRGELEKQNNLDAKAIIVSPDGTWMPKLERLLKRKLNDVGEDPSERIQNKLAGRDIQQVGKRNRVEIIVLDDENDD
ncbi:hypothetical protein DL98DRAFT_636710 [Cadophora sp. DSE1049]|nr:hypothetical protein DL98DRAFT_636710 [Cadophora sp. DSE1049]